MYSSRRYSVQRHINNKHAGGGTAITFVEYMAGCKSGKYDPSHHPNFGDTNDNIMDLMAKEVERIRIQRVAEKSLPPVGHQSYQDQANLLRSYIAQRLNLVRNSAENDYKSLFWELMKGQIKPA
jgi:hypothetical protein